MLEAGNEHCCSPFQSLKRLELRNEPQIFPNGFDWSFIMTNVFAFHERNESRFAQSVSGFSQSFGTRRQMQTPGPPFGFIIYADINGLLFRLIVGLAFAIWMKFENKVSRNRKIVIRNPIRMNRKADAEIRRRIRQQNSHELNFVFVKLQCRSSEVECKFKLATKQRLSK